jgi:hypothetical protein
MKNRMKNTVTTLATFLLMLPHVKAAGAVAMNFSDDLNAIPFGKTNTEVIAWLESLNNLVVYEDYSANVNKFYSFEAIQPFFTPGVQKDRHNNEVQFYPYLIKKYTVELCHSVFPSTFRFDLYFVRNLEQKYTLFMVYRVCRVESGVMDELFRHELVAREKKFGKPSNVWKTSYDCGGSDGNEKSEQTLRAQVAQYFSEKGVVFFMMNDNGLLQFKEFLYVSLEGWNTYLRQLEKVKTWE